MSGGGFCERLSSFLGFNGSRMTMGFDLDSGYTDDFSIENDKNK